MYTKPPKVIYVLFYGAAIFALLWLCAKYLFPWLSPFIISFLLAAMIEPAIGLMEQKLKIKRKLAAALCTLLLIGGAASILSVIVVRAILELRDFSARIPELAAEVSDLFDYLRLAVKGFVYTSPSEVEGYLISIFDSIPGQVAALAAKGSSKLFATVSGMAGKAPSILLFAASCGIGVYFFCSEYQMITDFFKRQIPEDFSDTIETIRRDLLGTLSSWMRSQLILTAITFCEVLTALLILRVDYSLLISLLIAVVDLLPVLGAGAVLVPWSLYAMLTGDFALSVGLIITFGVVAIVRSTAQAKLIGSQLGLHPIVTLCSIYVGYCAFGVWGMILAPLIAVTVKRLNDTGIVRLWKA